MKLLKLLSVAFLLFSASIFSRKNYNQRKNPDKFKQMYDLFATPICTELHLERQVRILSAASRL
jgi:hypothetical protein